MTFPSLPCYPCPHNASCCAYGTSLTEAEAATIEREHGPGLVYQTRWGEWRTRVRQKRCVLFRGGGCSIHATSYYPAVCRGFPFTDPITNGEYEYDTDICGEIATYPELIELGRRIIPSEARSAESSGYPPQRVLHLTSSHE